MIRLRTVLTAAAALATSTMAVPQASAASVSDEDTAFVRTVHQGNLTEIAAGQDAQAHATTACVKEVGDVLVRDHTTLDADAKALAGKLGIALPTGPSATQNQELASLREKAGSSAYDAAWLKIAEAGHAQTLSLIDREVKTGTNAEVVAAARAARPVVAMHLEMVRGGTCHAGMAAGTVHAGDGGQLAAAGRSDGTAALVTLAGGALLAGLGTGWLLRIRRRTAPGR
ncbi:DUF4142 domain-containing protein [Actinacidiphila sp. bgisy167]|uniref:DUF4142 domain-containing protein n=1 Tax=Actinacidiphila sp. bgisy167 TaxID=3413797 RepID=UPI003D74DE1F